MLLTREGLQESYAGKEEGSGPLVTTSQMWAGLEGAGAGPFYCLKGQ